MMKKINYIISITLLLALTAVMGCSEKDDPQLSEEEQRTELLTKTWSAESVIIDSDDVTDEFANFTITVDANLNYQALGATRSPQPWPSNGQFEFATSGSEVNVNKLVRDDGLEIFIIAISDDGSSMTINFNFDESVNKNGRSEAVSGDWLFELKSTD